MYYLRNRQIDQCSEYEEALHDLRLAMPNLSDEDFKLVVKIVQQVSSAALSSPASVCRSFLHVITETAITKHTAEWLVEASKKLNESLNAALSPQIGAKCP